MAALITRDHLYESSPEWWEEIGVTTRVGTVFGDGSHPHELLTHTFAIFDDDGILYYSGVCADGDDAEDGALDEAFRWASADAGATRLDLDGEPLFA